ncbi:cryptochrome/photolyase family protein [Brumimicrobium oceani]|uniref:Cryptochrome/photolyase family protein n=1 Tax=Brumimicrobium oceani TaxID=2100725 RepID=A0A2U2XBE3_9FLAO|nr:cryptochrome/photolyase family protein [Brumimicrobium oceani]PWH85116.1 cryptochrome/photolyase family protein [Brumimicrobium oceani]
MKKAINIIFPHQLFEESELLSNKNDFYIIEEHLFFKQYKFHKQKIAFHRATMKMYQAFLEEKGHTVKYIEANDELADIRNLEKLLKEEGIESVTVIDPVDNYLEKRLQAVCKSVELELLDSPQFINTKGDLSHFFKPDKKSFFQTTFYKQQRKNLDIMVDKEGEPEGGKWTYDTENRKKYPKGKTPPSVQFPSTNEYWKEAIAYTAKHFEDYPGELSENPYYPIDFKSAQEWLEQFFEFRFYDFGIYEDAIVKENSILNHSVISPLLNNGLLIPTKVIDQSLKFAKENDIPINSTEGFVRQIIGWREFIRGMYECKGTYSRTKNYWNFDRKIPKSFYDGTTGIEPIDQTIKKVLKTGYCHHIERLMVVGNFMLLCEFDPKEVYRWFMELFIDAYDWVMVPNVYGMTQFADGGTFATKPYVGGSNYIKKMSDYSKGDWEPIWDGLFWRFISEHQDFFKKNPRTGMMVNTWNKMSEEKKEIHLGNAEGFLEKM